MRELTFGQAIGEALAQGMERDPGAFLIGEYVDSPRAIFGTTAEAMKKFGKRRVLGMPLAENGVSGICVGAAAAGMHPVMVHERNDFLMLAMDQIANHAAKYHYMTGGRLKIPFTIRAIIGRGWGQAAQHSQSLQAVFAHIPGLKVVMPASAYDAKGLLLAAMAEPNPVVYLEHRWLHKEIGEVPPAPYVVPIGEARLVRPGRDATVVALSLMVLEAATAAAELAKEGIEVEVIDLRSVSPWDKKAVLASVRKTGRLVIADTGGVAFGVSAEIAAIVGAEAWDSLRGPIRRVGLPAAPTPCTPALEEIFYPGAKEIAAAVRAAIGQGTQPRAGAAAAAETVPAGGSGFVGPF